MAPIAFVTTGGCANSEETVPLDTIGCAPGWFVGPAKIVGGVGDLSVTGTIGPDVFSGIAMVGAGGVGMGGSDTVPIVTSGVDLSPGSGVGGVSDCGNNGKAFGSGVSGLSTWGSTI